MLNKLRPWAVPLGLLAVMIASFGLLIPWLGFYWDDWSVLMTARMRGISGFWEYYAFDRPFLPWIYVVFMPLLRTSPAAWQIFALLLRWGTALSLWAAFASLWPKHKKEAALTAFLFAIYPIFTEQAVALQYSQQWVCYILYALSIALMVWAWRKSGPLSWVLTLLAMLAATLQMFTMEYFVGLELLRPFIIWILVSERQQPRLKRVLPVLLGWLPYLAPMVIFVAWRLFFLKLPLPDPNTPSLLFKFFSAPLAVSFHLIELALQDMGFMLITVWANLFSADNLKLDDHFILISWGLALAVALGLFFFLHSLFKREAQNTEHEGKWGWHVQAAVIGLAAILCGMLPIWLTDRQLMLGMHSDRFGMPAMLGTSLLLVAFITWLGISFNKQILFVSLLVGLAAGQHLRIENDYRWAWVAQSRFYWQMVWRAPAIQPNTSIFADGEFLSYMSGNAITTGIDLLYAPPQHPTYELPYYFYSLGRDYSYRMPDFLSGIPTHENSYRIYHFNGTTTNALVIDSSSQNNCLHVLSPDDLHVPGIPPLAAQALPNVKLSLIQPGPAVPGYPPADIFGTPPDLPWCRLYQEAELARQLKDWKKVSDLGDQAAKKGFTLQNTASNTAYEWLPFIDGFARTAHLDTAQKISTDILAKNAKMNVQLCQMWSKIHDDMPQADFSGILKSLGCSE